MYLCGIADENMGKWKQLTNILGANRRGNLSADLTHVVVGIQCLDQDFIEKVRYHNVFCAVLSSLSKVINKIC